MNRIFSLFFILLVSKLLCNAQDFSGKVIDAETNQIIPLVHIYFLKGNTGTISNEQGEFVLHVGDKSDTILFSHVAYEPVKMLGTEPNEIIRLKPRTVLLSEVVVEDYAREIMSKAYKKTIAGAANKNYGKAFYRQVTKNDGLPTEIHEIFYSIESTGSGVTRQVIDDARYGLKKRKEGDPVFVHFSNLSALLLGSGVTSTVDPEKKPVLIPFMPNAENYYSYFVKERFEIDGNHFVVIHFDPNEDVTKPALKGDVIIDENTYDIYKFDVYLNNSLGADKLRSPAGTIWPAYGHLYHFVFDFKKKGNGTELNFIEGNVDFDFESSPDSKHKVNAHAILFVYEQDIKKPRKLQEVNLAEKDLDQIKKEKYNAKFWKDNPVVKRTQLQDDVIKAFENSEFFGSMVEGKK